MYNESFEQYVYRLYGNLKEESPFYKLLYDVWYLRLSQGWGCK